VTAELDEPVFAAQVFMALGDRDRARRLSNAAALQVAGHAALAVRLADVELRLGRADRALTILRKGLQPAEQQRSADASTSAVLALQPIPAALLFDVARTYLRIGSDEGRQVLEAYRRSQPSPEADRAWALGSVSSRRAPEIAAWLRARGIGDLSPDFVKQLVFAATHVKAFDLAAEAAGRLVAERGSDSDRLLMAETFVTSGRPLVRMSAPGSNEPSAANLHP
jgi:hypothetical protein